jgi:hypothetical protein
MMDRRVIEQEDLSAGLKSALVSLRAEVEREEPAAMWHLMRAEIRGALPATPSVNTRFPLWLRETWKMLLSCATALAMLVLFLVTGPKDNEMVAPEMTPDDLLVMVGEVPDTDCAWLEVSVDEDDETVERASMAGISNEWDMLFDDIMS